MPRERSTPPPFEPEALDRSLDRYLVAGLLFMAVLIAGFVIYRIREPSLRRDAAAFVPHHRQPTLRHQLRVLPR